MPYQSILSLLQKEFAACAIEGTSVTESGLTVSIKPMKEEKIYFYHTDCTQARECLHMPKSHTTKENNNQSCDYLILYKQTNKQGEILCFLELKAKGFSEAADQIINTYKHLNELIKDLLEVGKRSFAIHAVSICLKRRTPFTNADKRKEKGLKTTLGCTMIYYRSGTRYVSDMGEKLLRPLYAQA